MGPFTAGKLCSVAGAWIHNTVCALLAYELTGSAFVVGLVSLSQSVPQLLLAAWSGARADRHDRRRQLLLGRGLLATGSAGLALWVGLSGVDGLPGVWPVLASNVIVGVGFVVGGPAMQALLPELVSPEELPAAVLLDQTPMTLGRSIGPALGALVSVTAGPAAALGLAAACSALFWVIILWIRVGGRASSIDGGGGSVRDGMRQILARPAIVFLLLGIAAVGAGADPALTLGPPIADELGGGASLVGTFSSALGVGTAIAYPALYLVRRRLDHAAVGTTGVLLVAAGLGSVATVAAPAIVTVGFATVGVGLTLSLAAFGTLLLQSSPDHLRGRVMGLWFLAFIGVRPIASTLAGSVTDLISVNAGVLAIAAWALGTAGLVRPSRIRTGSPLVQPVDAVPGGT